MAEDDSIEIVRLRAYQIWEHSGRPIGRDLDHWLQAELECQGAGARRSRSAKRKSPGPKAPPKRAAKPARSAPRA
jgi:Protein of unknown function (DUF2934)